MEELANYLIILSIVAVCLLGVGILIFFYVQRRNTSLDEYLPPSIPSVPVESMLREVPPDIIPKVERLSAQGQKIEAIKIVREATHWGLKESKDYVESLIVDGYATPPQRSALTGLTPAVMAKVQDLLSHHHHIEAIKLVREATGWGLKESKEYVETLKVK